MFIVIVGGGKVGEFLAKTLKSRGHDIVLVEKDANITQKLSEDVDNILVISGDGCDPHILEDAGMERAQVVAAVTGDDEDNLVICQLAKETFGVPRAIARINNPKNQETFNSLGVDAVSSTTVIAKLIEEEATVGDIITLLTLKRGQIAITETVINAASPAARKMIKDLVLPAESVITTIIRGDKVIFPKGNTVIEVGDDVIALALPSKEKELKRIFLGKS
ncbi:MAG: NAD-binding protein [Candidatus Margulisbacteria bacterium]|nr:NAD-binding protein [Candidatus Margulisiibacteriota bacterium]MBU1021554.1 NAD-binding protein [Candidatus Margulisiibacteriota bacterium]MBU1728705.1 NAD-binding protein [Candidatus Margulisiibacteriota bacterium]MBU1955156.1 NAD-binding protein [Candidatus Margulisiibacteriota bacterium]